MSGTLNRPNELGARKPKICCGAPRVMRAGGAALGCADDASGTMHVATAITAMKLMVRQLAEMAFSSRVAFTMPTSRSLAGCYCCVLSADQIFPAGEGARVPAIQFQLRLHDSFCGTEGASQIASRLLSVPASRMLRLLQDIFR